MNGLQGVPSILLALPLHSAPPAYSYEQNATMSVLKFIH